MTGLRAATMPVLLVEATPSDRGRVLGLFTTVTAHDPAYAPTVTSGKDTVASWFDRKGKDWACLALSGGQVVGHVAVRRYRKLPDGTPVPAGRDWEMCRLAVHPAFRRTGIARLLVTTAMARYGATLWATCTADRVSHALMAQIGWTDHAAVGWDDDPLPGVCLFAPDPMEVAA